VPTRTAIDEHIGSRLRRRRRLMGMTQHELAKACGVRFQQIQKYECGANAIGAARLWELAHALGVPVGYFYEGLASREPRGLETEELVRTFTHLDEARRRRFLDLVRAMNPGA
jgi:transcriptional regulator with XRE-family HTH domain